MKLSAAVMREAESGICFFAVHGLHRIRSQPSFAYSSPPSRTLGCLCVRLEEVEVKTCEMLLHRKSDSCMDHMNETKSVFISPLGNIHFADAQMLT